MILKRVGSIAQRAIPCTSSSYKKYYYYLLSKIGIVDENTDDLRHRAMPYNLGGISQKSSKESVAKKQAGISKCGS